MRRITLYSSRNGRNVLDTDARTWGEIKEAVGQFYDLSTLKAAESINKTTLESDAAVLPTEDFTIFLRPKNVKAGNINLLLDMRQQLQVMSNTVESLIREANYNDTMSKSLAPSPTIQEPIVDPLESAFREFEESCEN